MQEPWSQSVGEGLSHESFGYRPHVYREAISERIENNRAEEVKSYRAIGFIGVVPERERNSERTERPTCWTIARGLL